MQWEPVHKNSQAKIRSAHQFHANLDQPTDDTLRLDQVEKENVVSSRVGSMVKRKNKCCRHNRIQKPKVQNLEAKHTNFIGVFRIQETAQLELGR